MQSSIIRSRWAAVGAAVAVTLGAGSIGLVSATSPAGATAYSPIEPCRVADTRAGEFNVGDKDTPIGQEETFVVTVHGANGECTGSSAIPTSATGVQLNITSLNATTGTFLAVWGSGAQPNVSSLNPQPGQPPIPNAVTTGLTGAGEFNIFNKAGSVDVIVDIVGFYSDHRHTGADIVDGSLTGADISDGSLSGDDLLDESVSGDDLEDGSVTGDDIQNNSVTNVDLQNESGVAYDFMSDVVGVTETPEAYGGTSMNVPSDGHVTVHVTGQWRSNTAGKDLAFCQIQKNGVGAIDFSEPWFRLDDFATSGTNWTVFSAHRSMPISRADNPALFGSGQTINVVCTEQDGTVALADVQVTATFHATSYRPTTFVLPVFPVLPLEAGEGPTD